MSVSAAPAQPLGDRLCENGFECVKILPATNDAHGGVIVDLKEAMDSDVFATLLRSSLLHWKQLGKDGVWIKLPIELVHLVEAAVKEGFWYHHAEPSYLMLVYWIPKTGCTIPPNASHRVAVGAIVLNDKKEVLVVQEKRGGFHGIGVWKIPTGVVDVGEEIFEAAIREVKEETGIDTEFVEILAFRHIHNSFFGKSDLSFVCMLRPLSFDIKMQELEIEAAQWMPFDEFAVQPFNQMHEPFKYIIELYLAKVEKVYNGFSPRPVSSYFVEELNYLYLNSHDLDKSSKPALAIHRS
ncbi:nudix hydrolase 10-like [Abrus precatorius]|uniref:Nudix hydrolase 10-like n=1 Tax=Abrus precatorius TaxID=3816 RepID=A0A8B8KEA4_ABRPR|nr:nudix hydrolase 10-like [Abrus precatorius]XP_027342131.1 nudix hydrolase 10-like [Abrus precatorius]XP_027342132.1 nudix hydrolase 10-like [Abrus precatorius]XP_027342133.1 nudix hydrolase 10-like [Abrus precatorius]